MVIHSPPDFFVLLTASSEKDNAAMQTLCSSSPEPKTFPGTKTMSSLTVCLLIWDKFTEVLFLLGFLNSSETLFHILLFSDFDFFSSSTINFQISGFVGPVVLGNFRPPLFIVSFEANMVFLGEQ